MCKGSLWVRKKCWILISKKDEQHTTLLFPLSWCSFVHAAPYLTIVDKRNFLSRKINCQTSMGNTRIKIMIIWQTWNWGCRKFKHMTKVAFSIYLGPSTTKSKKPRGFSYQKNPWVTYQNHVRTKVVYCITWNQKNSICFMKIAMYVHTVMFLVHRWVF